MEQTTGHDQHDDHGDGLQEDLARLASRRDELTLFGAGGAAAILATLGASQAMAATPTAVVPTGTAGPYPGDGSNDPDVQAVSKRVYATRGSSASPGNLARTSLSSDNVFGNDEAIHQLATVTGSVTEGYVANLTIAV